MKPTTYTKARAAVLFGLLCVITKFKYDNDVAFETGARDRLDDFVIFLLCYDLFGKWGVVLCLLIMSALFSYGAMFLPAIRKEKRS